MSKRRIVIDAILIALVGVLAWSAYNARRSRAQMESSVDDLLASLAEPLPSDPLLGDRGGTVPDAAFDYLNRTGSLDLDGAYELPLLLVVFTTDDCVACFMEAPFWERIASVFGGRLEVVGIVTGRSEAGSISFLSRFGITIPTAYDPDGLIVDALGLRSTGFTPVKALVGLDGDVLHLSRTTYDRVVEQMRYTRTLQYLGETVAQ